MAHYIPINPSLLGRHCRHASLDDFDITSPGNRYWEVAGNEVATMPGLPTIMSSHVSHEELVFDAGHRPRFHQNSGVASITKLEDVYFDATNFMLFTRDTLFIEPYTHLDVNSRLDRIDWASTATVAPFTDNIMVCDQRDNRTGAGREVVFLDHDMFARARRVEHPCLLLAIHGTSVYYHWLIEGLARTWYLHAFPQLMNIPRLLPINPPGYVLDTLRGYGVSEEHSAWFDGGIYHFKTLIVPSYLTPLQDAGRRSVDYLRKRAPVVDAGDLPRRFYISRNDAVTRQIGNEAAILAALEPYGVRPLSLTGMPFAKQVALFREAELVVAPHGGGLANLVYGRDTAVVELSPRRWHPCFWHLTGLVGARHAMVMASSELQRQARHPYIFRTGTNPIRMEFDVGEVVAAVEAVLGR